MIIPVLDVVHVSYKLNTIIFTTNLKKHRPAYTSLCFFYYFLPIKSPEPVRLSDMSSFLVI